MSCLDVYATLEEPPRAFLPTMDDRRWTIHGRTIVYCLSSIIWLTRPAELSVQPSLRVESFQLVIAHVHEAHALGQRRVNRANLCIDRLGDSPVGRVALRRAAQLG